MGQQIRAGIRALSFSKPMSVLLSCCGQTHS